LELLLGPYKIGAMIFGPTSLASYGT
jgi:hypothetical protein